METAAPGLARRVGLIVGLFCHFNLELRSVLDLLAANGVDPAALARLEYRGGPWPGGIRAVLRDGRTVPLHRVGIKEVMTFLLRRYSPPRCHLCVDAAAEFADVAVGDFWAIDYRGDLAVDKHSLVLARSERGVAALATAREAGALALRELPPEAFSRRTLAFFREKKHNAWLRIGRRARRGLPVPRYGLPPPPLAGADRRREAVNRLTMSFRCGRLNRLLTALYVSRAGALLVRLNERRKKALKNFRVG
jgi:coenzyme F420 hydrogenase subunit beta